MGTAKLDSKDGTIVVDFSSKGGPKYMQGFVWSGGLSFADGNCWQRVGALPLESTWSKQAAADDVGGLYKDLNHYKAGSHAGLRYVSARYGKEPVETITMIGSDDGEEFWAVQGKMLDRGTGKLTMDFGPKGGPGNLAGTYAAGKITWSDGNAWERM